MPHSKKFQRVGLVAAILVTALLPRFATAEPTATSVDVVTSFVEAYNNHDIEQMMEYCSENVRWLTVIGDAVSVEAEGKATLRSAMKSHFENSPNTHSRLLVVEGDGPMVVAIENAMSDAREPARSQCAASVYQVKGGLIENVWYFDAYRCGETAD